MKHWIWENLKRDLQTLTVVKVLVVSVLDILSEKFGSYHLLQLQNHLSSWRNWRDRKIDLMEGVRKDARILSRIEVMSWKWPQRTYRLQIPWQMLWNPWCQCHVIDAVHDSRFQRRMTCLRRSNMYPWKEGLGRGRLRWIHYVGIFYAVTASSCAHSAWSLVRDIFMLSAWAPFDTKALVWISGFEECKGQYARHICDLLPSCVPKFGTIVCAVRHFPASIAEL